MIVIVNVAVVMMIMTDCKDCGEEFDDKKGYCYEYAGKEYHYCFNCEREKELEK